MIAAAEPNAQGEVSLSGRFADPRFERVYSGWYWQIMPVDAKTSRRRADFALAVRLHDQATDTRSRRGRPFGVMAKAPISSVCASSSQRIEFPDHRHRPAPNDARAYTFLVAGDMSEVEAEVHRFNGTLDLVVRVAGRWD